MSSDGIATGEGWVCSKGVDDVGVVRAVISLIRPIFGEKGGGGGMNIIG
jgi:hypothetical protein